MEGIGYDAHDVEPAVVGSADRGEVPRPIEDGDGLLACVVEGRTGEGEGAGCGCLVWGGGGGREAGTGDGLGYGGCCLSCVGLWEGGVAWLEGYGVGSEDS